MDMLLTPEEIQENLDNHTVPSDTPFQIARVISDAQNEKTVRLLAGDEMTDEEKDDAIFEAEQEFLNDWGSIEPAYKMALFNAGYSKASARTAARYEKEREGMIKQAQHDVIAEINDMMFDARRFDDQSTIYGIDKHRFSEIFNRYWDSSLKSGKDGE